MRSASQLAHQEAVTCAAGCGVQQLGHLLSAAAAGERERERV